VLSAVPNFNGKATIVSLATHVSIESGAALCALICDRNAPLKTAVGKIEGLLSDTNWKRGKRPNFDAIETMLRHCRASAVPDSWIHLLVGTGHLAHHKSTASDVERLMKEFDESMDAIVEYAESIGDEVLVARSEEYRPRGYAARREVEAIREEVLINLGSR